MKLHFEPNLLEDFKAKLGRQGAPLTKKSIRSRQLKLSRFNAGTVAGPGFSDSDIPAGHERNRQPEIPPAKC